MNTQTKYCKVEVRSWGWFLFSKIIDVTKTPPHRSLYIYILCCVMFPLSIVIREENCCFVLFLCCNLSVVDDRLMSDWFLCLSSRIDVLTIFIILMNLERSESFYDRL